MGSGPATRWLVLAAALLGACTNTVVRPPAPASPATAFLLDHGAHASVVIAQGDGVTRYSYGHWAFYVQNRRGPLRASGTLFGSSPAGIGRRRFDGPATLGHVRQVVRVPIEAAWRFEVERARARRLAADLDALFAAQPDARVDNPLFDLEFVRHPEPYRLGHNSNHVAGDWLRRLGCEVRMGGPYSSWRVLPAPGAGE